ncbi:hypothetical protein [Vibrio cholerae]|uniref:hypothetical protein n=1 Tax=Vibrio cholerae TaxID=666 RepID=UPI003017A622
MAVIYKNSGLFFPKMRIKAQIESGRITEEISLLLEQELVEIELLKPNSWDVKFIKNMIRHGQKLTEPQKRELERILQDHILAEDYPNGIEL